MTASMIGMMILRILVMELISLGFWGVEISLDIGPMSVVIS
jgi:hypothetical protein